MVTKKITRYFLVSAVLLYFAKFTTAQELDGNYNVSSMEIMEAQNLDEAGIASPISFDLFNWQHTHYPDPYFTVKYQHAMPETLNHNVNIQQRCSAEFVKCLVNLEMPYPVCAYNHCYYKENYNRVGYRYFENYCQVYLENCFFYHRRLRIISYGDCTIGAWEDYNYYAYWDYPVRMHHKID